MDEEKKFEEEKNNSNQRSRKNRLINQFIV